MGPSCDRRGSIWSIFLINGKGEKIAPAEVRRIDPVTPVVTEFFPYGNPYYGIFRHNSSRETTVSFSQTRSFFSG